MEGLVEETIKRHAPGDESSERVRQVLEGVPPISLRPGPGRDPESLAFPSSLRACMQAMGEDPAYDYEYHMGSSGAAFGLSWRARKWQYVADLTDSALNSAWEEPIRRFEPSGYFRKRGWYPDTGNLILIGEKAGAPPLAEVYRGALQWALEVVRTPHLCGSDNGLSAYTAWAADLLRDEDFPDDVEVLLARLDCHLGALSALAEGRWYAGRFLRRVAKEEPAMAEALEQAAACFDAETGLMSKVADLQGGWDPHSVEIARKLAGPEVRRQIAQLILQARDKDAEAAAHIEGALAK
jgi:hypothetical protein